MDFAKKKALKNVLNIVHLIGYLKLFIYNPLIAYILIL